MCAFLGTRTLILHMNISCVFFCCQTSLVNTMCGADAQKLDVSKNKTYVFILPISSIDRLHSNVDTYLVQKLKL